METTTVKSDDLGCFAYDWNVGDELRWLIWHNLTMAIATPSKKLFTLCGYCQCKIDTTFDASNVRKSFNFTRFDCLIIVLKKLIDFAFCIKEAIVLATQSGLNNIFEVDECWLLDHQILKNTPNVYFPIISQQGI